MREGKAGEILNQILGNLNPECAYFTEQNGTRSAVLIINISESSEIPTYAEPFFLMFNADCKFRIAMTPDDLGAAGLDELGKKWR